MFRVFVSLLFFAFCIAPAAAAKSTKSKLNSSKIERAGTKKNKARRARARKVKTRSADTRDRRRRAALKSRRRTAAVSRNNRAGKEISGGARPYIRASAPPTTTFKSRYNRGTVIIDTKRRRLVYVLSKSRAYLYPISVGRAGFQWVGTHRITAKRDWPTWTPPPEMRQRDPRLPKVMTGGLNNPLGAKALYLGSTLYRIHGTNNTKSIGRAASSGCFRMLNRHVAHLAGITKVGTKVIVLNALPARLAQSFSRPKTRREIQLAVRSENARTAPARRTQRRKMAWRRSILGLN
jgi:lipoprotein-anchoring transpeptidase ErfK/SrfK